MSATRIEWADDVWNPVTGCTPVSEGCRNCYARRMATRLRGRFGYPADDPFRPGTVHQDKMDEPLRWRKPRRVFVCSMGDLFHKDVKFDDVHLVWNTMKRCPQHIFIILTKRPKRMHEVVERIYRMERLGWAKGFWLNVWLGVSVEDQPSADERILWLLRTWAAVRFVSCEPLLGPVSLRPYLSREPFINWVIVGGETGPGARPMHPDWARSLRDQCQEAGVPFFFKHWGEWGFAGPKATHALSPHGELRPLRPTDDAQGWWPCARVGKHRAGSPRRLLDGREWNEWPKGATP